MKKRMLCILLLAAMGLSAMSCGKAETKPETTVETAGETTETETETTDEPDLPDTRMDGWSLRVTNVPVDAFGWAQITFHTDEINGEPLNDAIYNRDLALMERFGYTIEETTLENVEVKYIQEMVLAGDDLYDVCLVYDIRLPEVIGYAGSWDALPHIQLEKPWWNPDATGIFDINGEHYSRGRGLYGVLPVQSHVLSVQQKHVRRFGLCGKSV